MPIVRWRAVYSERGTCGSEGREPKPAGRNPVRRGCPYPIIFPKCWESEIEKLLDTLSGANPLLLQYANTRIEELDAERQKQLRLVADLTANSVSASQIDSITDYLDDWESVSFDDKRKVVDILISQIDATSESVTIHWKI